MMELLKENAYDKLIRPLNLVSINNLFARAVVEKHIQGKIYVDNPERPKTYYVVHPYGMSLLFGDAHNLSFNLKFRDYALELSISRDRQEWMQAYPNNWDQVLSDLFGASLVKSTDTHNNQNIIALNTRVNFIFNMSRFLSGRRELRSRNCRVVRTDRNLYHEMKGSVIPYFFWSSADDFVENGVGFSLICEDKLATTAYSAFILDDKLELGIETVPEFRGKGFAQIACTALIDYCLENGYEPIWACRLENVGSYKLAEKLGFEPIALIPYYKLGK
jgi:GNAT superfamily N-acetyltransferase